MLPGNDRQPLMISDDGGQHMIPDDDVDPEMIPRVTVVSLGWYGPWCTCGG